jgi:hypothetical protein
MNSRFLDDSGHVDVEALLDAVDDLRTRRRENPPMPTKDERSVTDSIDVMPEVK